MISAIRNSLIEHGEVLPSGTADVTGAIIAGIDRESSAKVTCLFFDRGGTPTIAAKVARTSAGERSLAAEYAVLRQLWREDSRAVRDCAPRPIALERLAGRLSLVTTVVAGGPMSARYYAPGHIADPNLVAEDFDAASTWLRRFHSETRRGTRPLDGESVDAWTDQVLDRYREEIGWSDTEADLFADIRRRGRELEGAELPVVAVHGDYWMGNLLVSGSSVTGVVDWELGRGAGLPFTDVYKFPTSYAFYLDRSSSTHDGKVRGHPGRTRFERAWRRYGTWPNLTGFAYGYFGDGWFPEQIRRFVLGHLSELGIPPAVNGVFFPLFLAQQAMVLDVPAFREGYRSLLLAFAEERANTWLWESPSRAAVRSR